MWLSLGRNTKIKSLRVGIGIITSFRLSGLISLHRILTYFRFSFLYESYLFRGSPLLWTRGTCCSPVSRMRLARRPLGHRAVEYESWRGETPYRLNLEDTATPGLGHLVSRIYRRELEKRGGLDNGHSLPFSSPFKQKIEFDSKVVLKDSWMLVVVCMRVFKVCCVFLSRTDVFTYPNFRIA